MLQQNPYRRSRGRRLADEPGAARRPTRNTRWIVQTRAPSAIY